VPWANRLVDARPRANSGIARNDECIPGLRFPGGLDLSRRYGNHGRTVA
jgi:hypothetical protein